MAVPVTEWGRLSGVGGREADANRGAALVELSLRYMLDKH